MSFNWNSIGIWMILFRRIKQSCTSWDHTGDVDLKANLIEWEVFYNYAGLHLATNGKTLHKRLKEN